MGVFHYVYGFRSTKGTRGGGGDELVTDPNFDTTTRILTVIELFLFKEGNNQSDDVKRNKISPAVERSRLEEHLNEHPQLLESRKATEVIEELAREGFLLIRGTGPTAFVRITSERLKLLQENTNNLNSLNLPETKSTLGINEFPVEIVGDIEPAVFDRIKEILSPPKDGSQYGHFEIPKDTLPVDIWDVRFWFYKDDLEFDNGYTIKIFIDTNCDRICLDIQYGLDGKFEDFYGVYLDPEVKLEKVMLEHLVSLGFSTASVLEKCTAETIVPNQDAVAPSNSFSKTDEKKPLLRDLESIKSQILEERRERILDPIRRAIDHFEADYKPETQKKFESRKVLSDVAALLFEGVKIAWEPMSDKQYSPFLPMQLPNINHITKTIAKGTFVDTPTQSSILELFNHCIEPASVARKGAPPMPIHFAQILDIEMKTSLKTIGAALKERLQEIYLGKVAYSE